MTMEPLDELVDKLKTLYKWADRRTGGLLEIVRRTIKSFSDARASEAAAGMAYYTFFSLFPLLLALVAAGSFVLERAQIYQQVVRYATEVLPISPILIEQNIEQVLKLRGAVGLIGLLGLLWSASGVFTILGNNVNRAWPEAEKRGVVQQRLVALAMIVVLTIPLTLSLLSSTVLDLLPELQIPLGGGVSIYNTLLWTVLSNLIPWLITFALFWALYRWVPNTEVGWRPAAWGGLAGALGWEAVTYGFTWYLRSGLARYRLVYGSLGTVAALLFWIYLSSWIILFGAHLSAAIAGHRRKGRGRPQEHNPAEADRQAFFHRTSPNEELVIVSEVLLDLERRPNHG